MHRCITFIKTMNKVIYQLVTAIHLFQKYTWLTEKNDDKEVYGQITSEKSYEIMDQIQLIDLAQEQKQTFSNTKQIV